MIECECEELGGHVQSFWIKFNKQKMSNKLNNKPGKGLVEVAFGFRNKNCDKTINPSTTEITTISDNVDQVKDVYLFYLFCFPITEGPC